MTSTGTDAPLAAPMLTVLLPVRNEGAFIAACLESTLAALDRTGVAAEVLVIDGESHDGTVELVRAAAASDARVVLLSNPGRTAPIGLNLGIRHARGAVIARLDGHALFPPDYFTACLRALDESGAMNVGGLVTTRARSNGPMARALAATTSLPVGVGTGFRTGTPSGFADTVPFGCFRRELFDRVGFFDERLTRGQDYEFNRRAVRVGARIWRDASIRVEYFQLDRLAPFLLKQLVRQGPAVAAMWCVAPWSMTLRHLAPLALVLVVSLLGLLAVHQVFAAAVLVAVLLAYEGAIFLSASRLVSSIGVPAAALVPLTITLYHVTYGLGIVLGLLAMPFRLLHWSAWRRPWSGATSFSAMKAAHR